MRKTFIKVLQRENLWQLWVLNRGDLAFLLPLYPSVEDFYKRVFTKGEHFTALSSQQRGHKFLHPQYPTTAEDFLLRCLQRENLWQLWVLNRGGTMFLHPQYPTTEDFIKGFTKGEPLTALGSQQRGPWFLHLQYPTAEGFWRENRQQLQVHCRWDLNFCRQDCSHKLILVFYSPISSLSHIVCFLLLCQEGVWKSSSMESGWHKIKKCRKK